MVFILQARQLQAQENVGCEFNNRMQLNLLILAMSLLILDGGNSFKTNALQVACDILTRENVSKVIYNVITSG